MENNQFEQQFNAGFNQQPVQQPIQQPIAYQQPMQSEPYAPPAEKKDIFGLISMICGIVGLVMSCCGGGGGILPIAAIVLACIGKSKNDGKFSKNGKIGLTLGIIALAVAVLLVIALIAIYILEFVVLMSGSMYGSIGGGSIYY